MWTHHAEGADDDVGRGLVGCNHLGDEVGGHPNDGNEGYGLHGPDDGEGSTESSEVGHFCWWKMLFGRWRRHFGR